MIHDYAETTDPASAPPAVNLHWCNTSTGDVFLSNGTASVANWVKVQDAATAGDASTTGGLDQFAATTSSELRGVLSDETGTGLAVFNDSPTFITPTIGVASATSLTASGTVQAAAFQLASGAIWGTHLVLNSGQWLTWDGGNLQLHFVTNDHLGQYNGTNAQFHSIANTWTSSTNNEFLEAGWASNLAHLWTTKGSGGGTARELLLGYDSTEKMRIGSAVVSFSVAPKLPSYTVAGVPSAATAGAGAMIYVSNESGGAVVAFSDGTNWKRVTDRATIS